MKSTDLPHRPLKITAKQRENLAALASVLALNSVNIAENFNMSVYAHIVNPDPDIANCYEDVTPAQAHNACMTSACAAGWGAHFGVGLEPRRNYYNFNQYVEEAFGAKPLIRDELWCWIFTNNWELTDNTPLGASKRITYALEHGVPIPPGTTYYDGDIVALSYSDYFEGDNYAFIEEAN